MSDWPIVRIDELSSKAKGSIAIGPFGSRMKSDCYVPSGIPVIRGSNITGGPNFEGRFVYITEEKANELGSANVYQDDLVFPHRGAIGEVGIILEDKRFVISSSLMKLTCDREKANPKLVYYFFRSKIGRHELLKNASQVGTPGIGQPLTSLKGIELQLPPISIQDQIEETLTSLDDKIELNSQTNRTLEQIAQAIFKSWFVDFEPVKAKQHIRTLGGNDEQTERAAQAVIAGAVNLDVITTASDLSALDQQLVQTLSEKLAQFSENHVSLLVRSAAKFPNQLDQTEHGDLPVGWRIKPLYETAKFINGAAFKSKNFSSGREGKPIIKIAELKSGVTRQTKFTTDTFPEKYLIDDHELLYSWSGSPNTSLEVFKWFGGPGWLNQHIFRVCTEDAASRHFVFFLLRQLKPKLISIATDKQTTGLGHVTIADMKRLYVAVPDDEVLGCFERMAGPLYNKASSCEQQSRSLADIRDSLLPKLLSGEMLPNKLRQIRN